jgi:DNA-binding NarL/FixJ family response regulator/signal transduction histidine kinase
MEEAVALVSSTLEVQYARIDELLPGGQELRLSAGAGWTDDVIESRTAPVGSRSLAGYTLSIGEPVIVDALASDPRFDVPAALHAPDAVSAAAVVIDARERPFGTLAALSRERQTFTIEDVDFLQAVANVIATAVERNRADKRLEEARDGESRRIARDLHDEALGDLGQALAEAQRVTREASDPAAAERLGRLVSALGGVGQQLSAAIYDLRLGADEDKPFPEVLESVVTLHRTMAAGHEIRLDTPDGAVGSLGDRGTHMLRIVGEALVNARRHSGAKTVTVALRESAQGLVLEVSDDGRGFDPPKPGDEPRGTGISRMRQRAAFAEAELTIHTEPGGGTTVRVEVPTTPLGAGKRVRVLLVDDHAAVRQAIAAAFDRHDDFEVVAQAGSLTEARPMLGNIDVAVIDLGLPDGYGGDLITELRAESPDAQALVLSANLDRAQVARAVQSGAAAALDKTVELGEVVASVRRLGAGETLMPLPEVVELLRFASRQREREYDDRSAIASLTAREREVLQAIADGLDSQQIAERLHITVRTERNHVANILAKLGVHSRVHALLLAVRYGVVEIR